MEELKDLKHFKQISIINILFIILPRGALINIVLMLYNVESVLKG